MLAREPPSVAFSTFKACRRFGVKVVVFPGAIMQGPLWPIRTAHARASPTGEVSPLRLVCAVPKLPPTKTAQAERNRAELGRGRTELKRGRAELKWLSTTAQAQPLWRQSLLKNPKDRAP